MREMGFRLLWSEGDGHYITTEPAAPDITVIKRLCSPVCLCCWTFTAVLTHVLFSHSTVFQCEVFHNRMQKYAWGTIKGFCYNYMEGSGEVTEQTR